jgi:MFS family permease
MARLPSERIPLPFFLVSAANFLFFLNFAFFFLLPLWILERGGGAATVGRVVGVSGLAGLVVLPLVGYLLDRFGRRRFMIVGALAAALSSAAYIPIETIGPALYVLRMLQGISFTCAFTGAQTLAVLFAPLSRRAAAIGWFGISTILTHAISPLLGEEIIRRWGFDAMFATGALLSLVAFAVSCTLPRPPELAGHDDSSAPDPNHARRAVMTASLAMVCYGVGFGAAQTFVPVLMERLDLGRVGVFFACWSVSAVSVRVLLGGASDRFGRRNVILPAMAAMSLAVLMLVFARSTTGMILVGLTFGSAQGLLYPTMNALVADWSSPHNIGRTQSLFSGSYSLGIAGCAFFFGTIVEQYGFGTMYVIAFAITLVGMVTFLMGPRDELGDARHEKKSSTSVLTTESVKSCPSR